MTTDLDEVDVHLKNIITNLYILITQAHDYHDANTKEGMTKEIKQLLDNLIALSQSARRLPTHVPVEIIQYVEGSRNPDIYTREFVELVMRLNQQLKGRADAFAEFRDILAQETMSAIPELKNEVETVLKATGGKSVA